MKVAMIVPSLKQAGPVNVAYDLVRLLVKVNIDCDVLYFDEFKNNIHCFPCNIKRISMNNRIDFNQYDVIHTHGFRPVRYVAKYRNSQDRAKFVTTIHNYVFSDFKYEYGPIKALVGGVLFLKACLKHDSVVTLSNHALKYYSKFLPKSKLHYVYNSRIIDLTDTLDPVEHEELSTFKSDCILIGANSALIERKAIDILIGSLQYLPGNYKLFISGDGKEKERLQKIVSNLGLKNRVLFAGFRRESHRYIPFYDIFVLPSRSEGFPLALIEAAAYGSRVVCTPLPVLIEAFSTDEVCFFKTDDPKDLAKCIAQISDDNTIGEKLRQKYSKVLAPHIMMQNYLRIYNDN